MNYQRQKATDAAPGIAEVDTSDGLATIAQPGCAAALWRRQPDPAFQAWIDGLDPAVLPAARLNLRPEDVRHAMQGCCDVSGLPDSAERTILIDDIAVLAGVFAKVMRARHLRLRLSPVNTDACRRFHIDALTARLICTYRGAGTQYGLSTDGAPPHRVFDAPTFAPFVLRGTDWPERPASGLLHRSPPIEGSGETRLVLVLDPVLDPDDAV